MHITKILERDMGHRLLDHNSKCHNLHGHRYKVEITLSGDILDQPGHSANGMVIDFSDIKDIAKTWIDSTLDHGYMFQVSDPIGNNAEQLGLKCIAVDFPPTAEHISMYVFQHLQVLYQKKFGTSIMLTCIKLWETPNSYVVYQW